MRFVFLLLCAALAGCRDYEALCAADDPSVDAETCWRRGWARGEAEGDEDAYDTGYADGYATCEEDRWYGW